MKQTPFLIFVFPPHPFFSTTEVFGERNRQQSLCFCLLHCLHVCRHRASEKSGHCQGYDNSLPHRSRIVTQRCLQTTSHPVKQWVALTELKRMSKTESRAVYLIAIKSDTKSCLPQWHHCEANTIELISGTLDLVWHQPLPTYRVIYLCTAC